VNVILEAPLSISIGNNSHDFKVRFPYSSLAFPKDDRIYYDSIPEPYIELENIDEPDLYYEGKTTIAYHFRGYFDIIVEEIDNNKTLIDSVILEDVIEISSHTDRMSYNSTRIQFAFSIILFIISIILFYNQAPDIYKRLFKNDTENSRNEETEKEPVVKEISNEKSENVDQGKNTIKKE
jgi:hypothetical protein